MEYFVTFTSDAPNAASETSLSITKNRLYRKIAGKILTEMKSDYRHELVKCFMPDKVHREALEMSIGKII